MNELRLSDLSVLASAVQFRIVQLKGQIKHPVSEVDRRIDEAELIELEASYARLCAAKEEVFNNSPSSRFCLSGVD